jgi:hypothetical protein
MLTPKDGGIDNWFNFLKINIFGFFYFFNTLDVGIACGREDVLT